MQLALARYTSPLQSADPMKSLSRLVKCVLLDESGQDLIEYALIAALVAVAAISAIKGLGNKVDNEFNTIGNSL
jgi:pilus assembly protein Flp/PilA